MKLERVVIKKNAPDATEKLHAEYAPAGDKHPARGDKCPCGMSVSSFYRVKKILQGRCDV